MSTDAHKVSAIVDGDNRFDVTAQVVEWGRDFQDRRLFWFDLQEPGGIMCIRIGTYINGITSHGISDKDFTLTGVLADAERFDGQDFHEFLEGFPWLKDLMTFEARYDTRKRKGTIRPRAVSS